jgi:NAD(P)-dependent dehydrogenase (short-subunit alcohol dehydrogenase family)
VQHLVDRATDALGRIDVYFANAGIDGATGVDSLQTDDAHWERILDVNVMAHVRAARLLVPRWLETGGGRFVVTASAAGLLTMIGSAPYSVTKHAAVAFAEWLRIAYGKRGLRVSCLCPQSVQTDMTANGTGSAGLDGVLTAEQVAGDVVATMRDEKFLVLPHPEVAKYFLNKAQNYDRWLAGMQKLYAAHAAKTS